MRNNDFVNCLIKTATTFVERTKQYYLENESNFQQGHIMFFIPPERKTEIYKLYGTTVKFTIDDVFTDWTVDKVIGLAMSVDFDLEVGELFSIYLTTDDTAKSIKKKFTSHVAYKLSTLNAQIKQLQEYMNVLES
jgi:hypothetical protein